MTPNNTLLTIPSPVIVPEDMEIEELELKALHDDDDEYVNPYSVFPDAAKMILVPVPVPTTPATAEIGELPAWQIELLLTVGVEFTLLTTLTLPLVVPTMRDAGGGDVVAELTVFNAVTPLVPAAGEVELVQGVRPLLAVMAKQSAGLLLDMKIDPA